MQHLHASLSGQLYVTSPSKGINRCSSAAEPLPRLSLTKFLPVRHARPCNTICMCSSHIQPAYCMHWSALSFASSSLYEALYALALRAAMCDHLSKDISNLGTSGPYDAQCPCRELLSQRGVPNFETTIEQGRLWKQNRMRVSASCSVFLSFSAKASMKPCMHGGWGGYLCQLRQIALFKRTVARNIVEPDICIVTHIQAYLIYTQSGCLPSTWWWQEPWWALLSIALTWYSFWGFNKLVYL